MDIFEKCPVLENDRLLLRLIEDKDADDLLQVYGDKFVLPFFNSDNCHGSNFYCRNMEDMANTIKYWLIEYHDNKCFVRFSIIDKKQGKAVGTIEMFNRRAEDFYDHCGILRLDLGRSYEETSFICDILALTTEPFYDWFACPKIVTKAAVYAVDRIEALKKMGFVKLEEPLIGEHNRAYYDYWMIEKTS
ncbi:MAG: GNAT family N-acetyltransferase [Lachnospiraceae bacterium]|nr:GNAT family N-acetyltransferase [Lachnospiraceae bacterium]